MRLSPGCCCGVDSCIFAQDDFNRADGTDITTGSSCGWTETAGAWSISSNTLVTSSANALALCGVTASGAAYFQADIKSSAAGDTIRFRFGSVRFEFEIGTPGKIRIINVDGFGTEFVNRSCDFDFSIATFYTVKACIAAFTGEPSGVFDSPYDLLGVTVSIDGTMVLSTISPDLAAYTGSCYLGTGTTVTGTVVFDNVIFGHTYRYDTACPNCAGLCCWPAGETLPAQLKLTIAGLANLGGGFGCTSAGECAAWDGEYILDLDDNGNCYAFRTDEVCACYSVTVSLACSGFSTFTKLWVLVTSFSVTELGCGVYVMFDRSPAGGFALFRSLGLHGPDPFDAGVQDPDGGAPGEVLTLEWAFSNAGVIDNFCDPAGMTATLEVV